MRYNLILFIVALAALLGLSDRTLAQHAGDVILGIQDCRIVTGDVQAGVTPARVFPGEFGDSGCDPFTANPGMDTFPVSGLFEFGTSICWNAVEGVRVWNGSGLEPTGGETIEISFVSQSVTIADAPIDGFCLFVQSDGGFHKHVDFCMNGCPNGCNPPPDADPGIYVLTLEFESTDPTLEPSRPFWLVFNYLDSEANQLAAMNWIASNLAGGPCPEDVDADGSVTVTDLLAVLSAWGACGECCPEDTDDSGAVNVTDLLAVLSAWGSCLDS